MAWPDGVEMRTVLRAGPGVSWDMTFVPLVRSGAPTYTTYRRQLEIWLYTVQLSSKVMHRTSQAAPSSEPAQRGQGAQPQNTNQSRGSKVAAGAKGWRRVVRNPPHRGGHGGLGPPTDGRNEPRPRFPRAWLAHLVEVPGIEPGSFGASQGLLRAQLAFPVPGSTGPADKPV